MNHMIQALFIRPKIRPYRTDNYYAALVRQAEAEREVEKIVRLSQKKNQDSRKFTMPEGLNKEEQRAVRKVIRDAQRNDGIPKTAQQSIPFDRMFPDGICRVGLDYYTKTIQYEDINYQLAQQEDKTEIFEEWCSFLNFFDSSVRFQLSFSNMANRCIGF